MSTHERSRSWSHAGDDHGSEREASALAPGKQTLAERLPAGSAIQRKAGPVAGDAMAPPNAAGGDGTDWMSAVFGGASVQRAPAPAGPGGLRKLQLKGAGSGAAAASGIHEAAALGTSGAGGALPHLAAIQKSFGRHDVSHVQAHTDASARAGAAAMGAEAFATGDRVAFAGSPSLHTAAHEAAHVIQQRGGVQLAGGVGREGDRYEQHADAVADLVVQGKSAEALLDESTPAAPGGTPSPTAQQQPARGSGLVQLFQGDGISIKKTTDLHEKRSSTSKVIETLEVGEACLELGGRTAKWVKVTAIAKQRTGWVREKHTSLQPGLGDDDGKPGKHAPEQFTELEHAPFQGEPSADDVSQGGMGDCWLLAPLAAIADTADGKQAIRSMIQPNEAAPSYQVRLFVPITEDSEITQEQHVTVDNWFAGTDDSIKFARPVKDHGIWPLIIEKAVAQLHGSYEKLSGGFITTAYLLVTGKRPQGYSAHGSKPGTPDETQAKKPGELRSILRDALGQDKPVTVSILPQSHSITETFKTGKDNTQYMLLPHVGVRKSTLAIQYPGAGGDVTLKGGDAGVDVVKLEGQTLLGLDAGAVIATGPAAVSYEYTGLEHEGTSFSGGHVYQLHAVSDDGKKLDLVDPHDTSVLIELPFLALGHTFNAGFYVGDAKVG